MEHKKVKFVRGEEVQYVSTKFPEIFGMRKNTLLARGFTEVEDSESSEAEE